MNGEGKVEVADINKRKDGFFADTLNRICDIVEQIPLS